MCVCGDIGVEEVGGQDGYADKTIVDLYLSKLNGEGVPVTIVKMHLLNRSLPPESQLNSKKAKGK